jgi:dTDP-4-dehydrorhamnose reductase
MRVYVTGGTGFVGSNVAKLYADWHGLEVVAAGRSRPEGKMPARFATVDLLDLEGLRASIRDNQPDLVVHAAIINDLARIYADRRTGWVAYVEATRAVVEAANEVGATVVTLSTDWVFDGTQGGSVESTPPNPINYYGFLKAASELVTLERAHDGLVARISGANGVHWARPRPPRAQDVGFGYFVDALVASVSDGRPFTVWESSAINTAATPSLASESAEMILRLVRSGARGTFHCCGGERATRLQLAEVAVDVFGLDPGLLRSGPPDPGAVFPVPIPHDTSLDARATASMIGYELPSLRTLLEGFRCQRETGELRPLDQGALR